MESLQTIKRRLKGVQNINQITKAMELVAATKMRRSQEIALASRGYAFTALDFLATLARLEGAPMPALLTKREVRKTAVVVVTSDKGLAGFFNSAVLKELERFIEREGITAGNPRYAWIAVGQKAARHLERRMGALAGKFTRFGDYTTIAEIASLAEALTAGYVEARYDRVVVISTHFKSALAQKVFAREVLPVTPEAVQVTLREMIPETGRFAELAREEDFRALRGKAKPEEYLIEPSPAAVLNTLAAHLVVMQIYHLILEANASEHAARRVAMKNASDNAAELTSDLTLLYNKSRQAQITKEIIEVTSGTEALQS